MKTKQWRGQTSKMASNGFILNNYLPFNPLLLFMVLLVNSSVYANSPAKQIMAKQHNQQPRTLLRVAVAANFAPALSTLIANFSQRHDIEVQAISGASGLLFQQLMHGAPFDLFLSADALRPRTLVAENIAIASSLTTYSVGNIALWSAAWPSQQPLPTLENALNSLLTTKARLAIANTQTAPYGLAAKQMLIHNGLWQQQSKRLITGININQTFQQARSQANMLAIVAKSQLVQNNLLGIDIPTDQYSPIIQQLVILKASKQQAIAQQFVDFLLTETSQNQLSQLGYQPISSVVQQR